MPHRELKNKPLLEAILEIRWQLETSASGEEKDPHYKLLLGRLFDRLQSKYPEYEPLPTASIPDELVGHVVQHRFRVASNKWPLIQVGPGVLTCNETSDYHWPAFQEQACDAVLKLYDAHPKVADLNIQSILLRYVDAVNFDHAQQNTFDFWREQLKVSVQLPNTLFSKTGVDSLPQNSALQTAFRCQNPRGQVRISFATGQKNDQPAIIWDTMVQSISDDLPNMPDGFSKWLDSAHSVTSDWFFKLIAGDLESRFDNE